MERRSGGAEEWRSRGVDGGEGSTAIRKRRRVRTNDEVVHVALLGLMSDLSSRGGHIFALLQLHGLPLRQLYEVALGAWFPDEEGPWRAKRGTLRGSGEHVWAEDRQSGARGGFRAAGARECWALVWSEGVGPNPIRIGRRAWHVGPGAARATMGPGWPRSLSDSPGER